MLLGGAVRHRVFAIAVGLLLTTPYLLGAQPGVAPTTPRLFVEGFRSTDTLTRSAAIAVRSALRSVVSPKKLWIMPTKAIEDLRAAGSPDDFGAPWSWADLREVGKVYPIDAILDLQAVRTPDGIEVSVVRVRPARTGEITSLPSATGRTMTAAAMTLARRLARDTILLRPRSP
jgi:hypothetical protein